MPFASSRGSLSSSQGFDSYYDADTRAAIHRLYLATSDYDLALVDQHLPSFEAPKGGPKPALPPIPVREAVIVNFELPEILPPMSSEPPMSLEEIVASTRWQRTRGAHSSSMSALPSASSTTRSSQTRSMRSLQSVSSDGNLKSTGSRFFPRGQIGAPARMMRRASQENTLVPAAREILAFRRTARENQFKGESKFTDGRRRAALMGCMEHLEREQLDPTFCEVSRKLQQEGWQMDEVKDHLLLLAEDPQKFNVTSGRELTEVRPQLGGHQSSHLPSIEEACGGSSQVDCALQVRGVVQDFKDRSETRQSLTRKR